MFLADKVACMSERSEFARDPAKNISKRRCRAAPFAHFSLLLRKSEASACPPTGTVGICNTEIPRLEHVFPLKAYATTDKGYVRYSGLNAENWYPTQKPASPKERLAQRNARYDYEYSGEELMQRVKGQLVLRTKTSLLAVAFNNHFQAKAVRNAMKNITILAENLKQ
jgi:uncharacterized protein YecE (DUF72 family)